MREIDAHDALADGVDDVGHGLRIDVQQFGIGAPGFVGPRLRAGRHVFVQDEGR